MSWYGLRKHTPGLYTIGPCIQIRSDHLPIPVYTWCRNLYLVTGPCQEGAEKCYSALELGFQPHIERLLRIRKIHVGYL